MKKLQLKRTNDLAGKLDNYILADGEPFIVQPSDIGFKHALLFVGDGKSTISTLRNAGNYARIHQKPQPNSIDSSMIMNSAITPEKLDRTYLDSTFLEEFGALINNYREEDSASINLGKAHYVVCDTASRVIDKKCVIKEMDELVYSESALKNLSLLIKFTYKHIGSYPSISLYNAQENLVWMCTDEFRQSDDFAGRYLEFKDAITNGADLITLQNYFSEFRCLTEIPVNFNGSTLSAQYYWGAGDHVQMLFTFKDTWATIKSGFAFELTSTTALKALSNWCYDNDMTSIDGGMIATGTITSKQILAGSITADKIAVGSLTPELFETSIKSVYENAKSAGDDALKNRTIVVTAEATLDVEDNSIVVKLTELQAKTICDKLDTANPTLSPNAAMIVTFPSPNKVSETATTLKIVYEAKQWASSPVNIVRLYKNDQGEDIFDSNLDVLNWQIENETRLLVYIGGKWVVSIPGSTTMAMAEWCKNNDQTYINGSQVITGKISCADLEAGQIDANSIALFYEYGGIGRGNGTTGTEITNGIKMYAGPDSDSANNYLFISNMGLALYQTQEYGDDGSYASLNMWGDRAIITSARTQFNKCPNNDENKIFISDLPSKPTGLANQIYTIETTINKEPVTLLAIVPTNDVSQSQGQTTDAEGATVWVLYRNTTTKGLNARKDSNLKGTDNIVGAFNAGCYSWVSKIENGVATVYWDKSVCGNNANITTSTTSKNAFSSGSYLEKVIQNGAEVTTTSPYFVDPATGLIRSNVWALYTTKDVSTVLNVRKTASSSGTKMGEVNPNKYMWVSDIKNGWALIYWDKNIHNGNGKFTYESNDKIAYVSSSYIKEVAGVEKTTTPYPYNK